MGQESFACWSLSAVFILLLVSLEKI